MKRYKSKNIFDIREDKDGVFVLYTETLEILSGAIGFAIKHREEIENDVDGFGELQPVLDMIPKAEH